MASNGGDKNNPTERDPLIRTAPLKFTNPMDPNARHSTPAQTLSMHNLTTKNPSFTHRPRSYSVSADGSVSHLTPVQMGRHELYEMVPFTAVFGLQRKERNLSRAFASFAADLDVMEHEDKDMPEQEREMRRSRANLVLLDELDMDQDIVTTPLIFAVFVAALAQFCVGYNTGVMNAPSQVVFPGHSTSTWSLAVAAFAIGAPFGSMLAGQLADTRGRRGALLIDTWTFLLGGIIQTCALDMFSIIVARAIIGFASGFASVLVPIYLGELAPPTLRGMLGTLTQFALVIGILASNILAFPFATESLWRVLFSVTPIISIVQLLCAPFLLESPRWLLNRDANSRKARFIIKKLRGLRYDNEVETEVNHFISASKAQENEDPKGVKKAGNSVLIEMFTDKKVRVLVISTIVLHVSQQLSGINAVFYYSNMFFDGVLDDPLVGTTIVGAVNVAAVYVALLLMDSCGRRTLILWSAGVMFLMCIVIVIALQGYLPNTMALAAVNIYVIFFEIGLGPIPWLIVAEMFDTKYVTMAMSVSCQINFFCNFIVGFTFPYLNKYLGPYSFAPFTVCLAICFVFTLFVLPETQGTTPEELQQELTRKNSTTIYKNMDIEASSYANPIDLEWRLAMEQLRKDEEEAMKDGRYNYGFQAIDSSKPQHQQELVTNKDGTTSWTTTMTGGV